MISELGGATEDLVRNMLDVTLLRYKVISNNIANNAVPGFKASDVKFETLLNQELAGSSSINNDQKIESALSSVKPEIVARDNGDISGDGKNSLDLEMSELAKNTLRYEALIKGLENLGSIKSMAITGGIGK